MSTIDWHPEDPATLADPYPVFARMRDEDPCFWSPRLKSWVLTRYDDVKAVCLDKERLSSDRLRPFFASLPPPEAERIGQIIRDLSQWMVFKDPPDHTRLRRLTSRVFHAKSMQAMRPQVEALAAWLMDGMDARTEFDFITDFAGPLPCLVIMGLLGVEYSELARVKRMSDDMALFIGSSRTSPEKYDTAEAATHEMAGFFRELIEDRRRTPRADLLSELVHLRDDEGDRLTEDELVATCILLLFAGHETTTNHIANGLLALMRFPDQMPTRRWPTTPWKSCCATTALRARRCASSARRTSCTARRWRPASACSSCSTPPTATRAPTPTPTAWTWSATAPRT